MSRVGSHTVTEEEGELRLDRWFRRRYPGLAHGRLEKLLRTGQVRVDGKRVKAGTRLGPGQVIRLPPHLEAVGRREVARKAPQIAAEDAAALRDRVLYMDDWLLALDKPAGLAVQGGSGQTRHLDGLLEALRFGADEPPRLVHRLDKDTSGVLLLARTAPAARALTAAFRDRTAHKTYWAAVAGVPRKRQGMIALPLAKRQMGHGSGERMAADQDAGRAAETLYRVVQTAKRNAAWLVLRPLTGRTHQLRVHCAAIGHPILGDGKYGGKAAFLERCDLPRSLHLHAREIAIPHPEDGTTLRVAAPLPEHMAVSWGLLGFDPDRAEVDAGLEA